MSDHDALLAAICAQPADDTVRLAFADWLDENDQEERAEFIRVQCELATHDIRPGENLRYELKAMMDRERELLDGPRPDIYSPKVIWFNSGDGTETWCIQFQPVFQRGFAESITCTAADWLTHTDAITRQHPVRKVTLTTWPTVITIVKASRVLGWKFDGRDKRHDAQPSPAMLKAEWPGITFELPSESAAYNFASAMMDYRPVRNWAPRPGQGIGRIQDAPPDA